MLKFQSANTRYNRASLRVPFRSDTSALKSSVDHGYRDIFTVDWWFACLAIFGLMSSLGGSLSVLTYIGSCGIIILRDQRLAWRSLFIYSSLLSLPILALISTLWSDVPDVTLKQSMEFFLTFLLAIMTVRRFSGSDLAAAMLVSGFAICLLSLFFQRKGLSQPLVGVMGSKNQMSFLSQVLLASAITVFCDIKFPRNMRFFAILGIFTGLICVILARSAGTYITAFASFLTFSVFIYFARISLFYRFGLFCLLALILMPLVFAYQDVLQVIQNFQGQVLHKDATLTGRTELWAVSKTVIAQNPLFGHGFCAFWQQGNLEAEGLWRRMGIGSRGGFNFHNQFLEIQVDFGLAGLFLMLASLVIVGLGSLWRAVFHPSLSAAFMTSMIVALYMRLPVESTLFGSWNVYTFIWLGAAIHAFSPIVKPLCYADVLRLKNPLEQSRALRWRKRRFGDAPHASGRLDAMR